MRASHQEVKHQLAIAKGQIDGLMRMVDEDAYCIDVSNQLLATIALLKKVNNQVITAHLEGCVLSAKDEGEIKDKLAEINSILDRMSR